MNYSRKHILNKHLKPINTLDGISLYPVYIQVIYKRKNYSFKSAIKTYYSDLKYLNEKDKGLMKLELDLLDDVLKFEFSQKGEKFEIAGFADKLNHYRLSAEEQGERILLDKLMVFVNRDYKEYSALINFQYSPGKFMKILKALPLLYLEIENDITFERFKFSLDFWEHYKKTFPEDKYEDFVRPSVFDWISCDHLSVMKKVMQYNMGDDLRLDFLFLEEFDSLMRQVTGNF